MMFSRIRKRIRNALPASVLPAANTAYDYSRWMLQYFCSPLFRKCFTIEGRTYPYFLHHYNNTWGNERAVEVSYVRDLVRTHAARGERILEIGNVLSNYFRIGHEVVDKYEKSAYPRLHTVDFNDYHPAETYDLIVSISTFEHIGKIDPPEFRGKVIDAVNHARELLAPDGTAVITVSACYNEILDRAIKDGRIAFDPCICMERPGKTNEWRRTSLEKVLTRPYIRPWPGATGLIIGHLRRRQDKA